MSTLRNRVVARVLQAWGKKAPPGSIPFGLAPYGHDSHEVDKVVAALREKGEAKVYDPKKILSTNEKLQGYIIRTLAADFDAFGEGYAERNADEDDGAKRRENTKHMEDAEKASDEMSRAKLVVKGDLVTTVPNFKDLAKKHHIL